MGKQKVLVKKLQTVQNEAVKVISGAFCTMPREPLHQLLTILPMDLRLNMIVQNAALRLYKLPMGSQLLRWLGGNWYTPGQDDLPLPTPNNRNINMTLCALAAHVPVGGPCIRPFLTIPDGAPFWNGKVKVIPKQEGWDYHQATTALLELCQEGTMTIIFCNGIVSNKD